ncbi:hypothetical protein CHS0354_004893 [Potamilus streckersoni]|uniref:Uncharacterized protein n=1 Tax=Potamilus streckersoni TaxID=2493646 RepID=A0AAE0SRG8_9BIVA|nr:hypothetical protein CHS0354_004893 [Potamilus streckersoni]
MTQAGEKTFKNSMKPYPSHFVLDLKLGSTKDHIKNMVRTLNDTMITTGFYLDAELTRVYNFLSYAHWRLKEFPKAYEYLEKALSKREDDVMALSNQAWMLWKDNKFSDAWRVLEKLNKLKDRKDLIIIAVSEQAFAYYILGPRFYNKSIDTFKEVIKADSLIEIDKTHIYLWKFGLGLILKRQFNMAKAFSFDKLSNYVESINEAVDVLNDVANNANTARCQAQGWVVLGEIAYSVHRLETLSSEDRSRLPKIISESKPDELFAKAISICDDDVYVLERCGKQARYSKDYSKSIELLRRSIEIKGTSFSHHHLAITLKSVLNTEIGKSLRGGWQSSRSADSQRYFQRYDRPPINDKQYQSQYLYRRETRQNRNDDDRGRGNIRIVTGRGRRGKPLLPGQCKSFPVTTSVNQETLSQKTNYPGGQDKKKDQVLHEPIETRQYKVLKFMKAPKRVLPYHDEDKRVEEIFYHLDKAIEYSPSNCSAMYDKGLVLRSLRRLEQAADLFGEIRKNKECSKLLAVSCTEQLALCKLELAEMESKPEIRETLWNDAKELLFSAIEKAADIATQVTHFHPRGTAFPSVREMLVRDVKRQGSHTKSTLKDFAKLYELVGEYGQALSFYTEIWGMKEDDAKDTDIILKMAQNYVKRKDFRDGLLFLDLIEASCTRLADENRKVYFEAYLEGALSALTLRDDKAARSRFRRTVRFCSKRNLLSDDGEEEDCTYDIHIMTSPSSEKYGFRLYKLLTETCGLKVSLNDNQTTENLKYDGIFDGIDDIMKQSRLIIIFLDNTSQKHAQLRYFINMAVETNVDENFGTGLISISLVDTDVPRNVSQFPVFRQQSELNFLKKIEDEPHQWLKNVFCKAAEQTFPSEMTKNETDDSCSD